MSRCNCKCGAKKTSECEKQDENATKVQKGPLIMSSRSMAGCGRQKLNRIIRYRRNKCQTQGHVDAKMRTLCTLRLTGYEIENATCARTSRKSCYQISANRLAKRDQFEGVIRACPLRLPQ